MNIFNNEFSSLEQEGYNYNSLPHSNEDLIEMKPLEPMFEEEPSIVVDVLAEQSQESTNDETINDETVSIWIRFYSKFKKSLRE